MPFDALNGKTALTDRIDGLNTAINWQDFRLRPLSTALMVKRRFGNGAYGQFLKRLVRRGRAAD
jgi:hypothetical protein